MHRLPLLLLLSFACRDAIQPIDKDDPPIVIDTDDATETDGVDTDAVDTDAIETDPAETDPVDTDPIDTDPVDTDPPVPSDADSDGVIDELDCAPADAAVFPGATEAPYDGVDNDCDPATVDDDLDADGALGAIDCDDLDPALRPGAPELCDSVDNDCDGLIDPDLPTWYLDLDLDGWGDAAESACEAPPGAVAQGGDCDDATPTIYPDAPERCDGVDQDCDSLIDDDAVDAALRFADADADGFGDLPTGAVVCAADGWVEDATDCDDTRGAIYPGAPELCDGIDQDCDGLIDDGVEGAATFWADSDGDGYGDAAAPTSACAAPPGHVSDATDCDDGRRDIFPGALEICDGQDQDCDQLIDDEAADAPIWHPDTDRDGFGDAASLAACERPAGAVVDGTDCDDAAPTVHPGAPELCDQLDNDCDEDIDEGAVAPGTFYRDDDGDGWGLAGDTLVTCTPPAGWAPAPGDCDDALAGVNPAATERCDGVDEDCDGVADDAASDAPTWWLDGDGDGAGGALVPVVACTAPPRFVAGFEDCDDLDPTALPGADEVCDGRDDDCDGEIDEGTPADARPWYADLDEDGYGDPASAALACAAPPGRLADASDCDDGRPEVNPAGTELCDGLDNDCDGTPDDGAAGGPTWLRDRDGDGFGDDGVALTACARPEGYVAAGGDCDDRRADVAPGADERCNGADDDCDTQVDEDATDARTWYTDGDGDRYGDDTSARVACLALPGEQELGGDCDDGDVAVRPGATELCNSADDDCDAQVDEDAVNALTWYADTDGDRAGDPAAPLRACAAPAGAVGNNRDCDDDDRDRFPANPERCDGVDQNCDGAPDAPVPPDAPLWYADGDGDGQGTGAGLPACAAPAGTAAVAGDCDDAAADIFVGAPEQCNGRDDDCDRVVDEDVATFSSWRDGDGDGWGDPAEEATGCALAPGYALRAGDCDDGTRAVSPSGTELCNGVDDDCDAQVDEDAADQTTVYTDADGDGWGAGATLACAGPGAVLRDGDCDDALQAVHPGVQEVCNGRDDDCDGDVDSDAVDRVTVYADADADGWGTGAGRSACLQPGDTLRTGDCADEDATISPGAAELCNGRDDDCDGDADSDAVDRRLVYADADADGWGDDATGELTCPALTDLQRGGDCDDAVPAVHPLATELCNGRDEDCDDQVDEDAADRVTTFTDADADGWGADGTDQLACPTPGAVRRDGDCDDGVRLVNPAATELCNGRDDDCDGDVDGGAVDRTLVYTDRDNDGWGAGAGTLTCPGPGDVTVDGDCADGDALRSPGATERCDGVDQDCDTVIDDAAVDAGTWYVDADGDGFGGAFSTVACEAPAGWIAQGGDCDDLDRRESPAADERCDGDDDDCDGEADEDDAIDVSPWYNDGDADGWGAGAAAFACYAPAGYVARTTDCVDNDRTIHPTAVELCDAVDQDCDGDPANGVIGEDPICAADSCLDVLERGQPTGSDTFWLTGPRQVFCDFGTVADGWATRAPLRLTNPTGAAITAGWIPFELPLADLFDAGELQPNGEDLRVFTLDGPLLRYWVDLQPGARVARVWVERASIAANSTVDLVVTWDNPDTERKSLSRWFDRFDTNVRTPYTTVEAWAGTPTWGWRPDGTLGTDNTNADYMLQLSDVDLTLPVYVETLAQAVGDNDGVGVAFRDRAGGKLTAAVTDDYQGVVNTGGIDGMARFTALPSAHYLGTFVGPQISVASSADLHRVGLLWDGTTAVMYVDGVEVSRGATTLDPVGLGLQSFACEGAPGAVFRYLWVGDAAMSFNPEGVASAASGSLGLAGPF